MADSLTGMFLSFNVGHFTWAPFSIYEVVTYIIRCFYSISSAKDGTVNTTMIRSPETCLYEKAAP
jgi:hypothetical protein